MKINIPSMNDHESLESEGLDTKGPYVFLCKCDEANWIIFNHLMWIYVCIHSNRTYFSNTNAFHVALSFWCSRNCVVWQRIFAMVRSQIGSGEDSKLGWPPKFRNMMFEFMLLYEFSIPAESGNVRVLVPYEDNISSIGKKSLHSLQIVPDVKIDSVLFLDRALECICFILSLPPVNRMKISIGMETVKFPDPACFGCKNILFRIQKLTAWYLQILASLTSLRPVGPVPHPPRTGHELSQWGCHVGRPIR